MELHEGVRVVSMSAGQLHLEARQPEAFDECLWCTQASAPAWLQETGLALGVPHCLSIVHFFLLSRANPLPGVTGFALSD